MGPFDDIQTGEEEDDLRSKGNELLVLLIDIIEDLDLDLTALELREGLLKNYSGQVRNFGSGGVISVCEFLNSTGITP